MNLRLVACDSFHNYVWRAAGLAAGPAVFSFFLQPYPARLYIVAHVLDRASA
jgi:hypothetical protein